MPLNIKKFQKQVFEPREREVHVSALKPFFSEGEEPVWKVRGLTADEIYRCNEAAEKSKKIEAIIEGISSESKGQITEAIKQLTGVGSDVAAQTATRLQQLVFGSVEPEVSLEHAVKLSDVYPVEFIQLTNEILTLTGLGKVMGKCKLSGDNQI